MGYASVKDIWFNSLSILTSTQPTVMAFWVVWEALDVQTAYVIAIVVIINALTLSIPVIKFLVKLPPPC